MSEVAKDQILKAAIAANFGPYDKCGMSGASDFDEQICVGEYPCGLSILGIIEQLGFKIIDLTETERKIIEGWK